MAWVAALAFGYLLGSIPWGLLLTRGAGLGDIRAIGSGNIGATNVLRTGNKGLAAATLVLDVLKGVAALLIAEAVWGEGPGLAAGFGAMLGHAFPVWLGFRGGKGVATGGGVLLAASWWMGLAAALVWLAVAALTRLSSAADGGLCGGTLGGPGRGPDRPRALRRRDRAVGGGPPPRQHHAPPRRHRAAYRPVSD